MRLWIAQAIATDGLQSVVKAVKIEVFRDEPPDINYMHYLKAQAIGQYRVQYGEWTEGSNVLVRFRERENPDPEAWQSIYESLGGPDEHVA